MSTLQFKPGQIILCTAGAYSDYGDVALLVTLTDCNLRELAKEYKAQYVPKNEYDNPDEYGFSAWLVATQRCAPVTYSEAHLGAYGRLYL